MIGRVGHQVETPKALDRDRPSRPDGFNRDSECRIAVRYGLAVLIQESKMGTAVGTGDGLRMKPSIVGILVFGSTGWAHRKGSHGGVHPVVGQTENDAETWSAMGAVDKRIPEAAVRRVVHFLQAFPTYGDIGQYERHFFPGPVARADLEPFVSDRVEDSGLE